ILDQPAPVRVERATVSGSERFALGAIAATQRDERRALDVLGEMTDIPEAVRAGADDADSECAHACVTLTAPDYTCAGIFRDGARDERIRGLEWHARHGRQGRA